MKGRGFVFFMVFFVMLSLNLATAAAADYPTQPIEITIGYAAGAGTDLGTRMLAEQAKQYLGQDMICINKPGGAGRVTLTLISKKKPDGYSLGATTDSSLILVPHIDKVPYKPMEDFTFISQFGILNFGLTVVKDSPFKTFNDLLEFARTKPDELIVGVIGVGSSDYVFWKALAQMKDLKIKIVPFSGAAPTMTALLGGHIMAACPASSGYAPNVRAGAARLLAVLSDERLDNYPDVPTLKELGFPEFVFQSWYLISGPKGIEKPIVNKLADAFGKSMMTPEFIRLAKDLEIYKKNTLHGDALRQGIMERDKVNGELLKKLGMSIEK